LFDLSNETKGMKESAFMTERDPAELARAVMTFGCSPVLWVRERRDTVGRIVTPVKIENVSDPEKVICCDALVDTGACYLTLPSAWRHKLGNIEELDTVKVETATQDLVDAIVCGPVRIQVEGFRPVYNEVLFVDVHPEDGVYEPLVGYLVLEQSQAAVDVLGHRLIHVHKVDLK